MVEVLRRQKELGQTNQECAASEGMSVDTIKRWRARLRVRAEIPGVPLIEWTPVVEPGSPAQLLIDLPDGIRLTVPGPWSPQRLAELVVALRSS
jgi:hypothetical protein